MYVPKSPGWEALAHFQRNNLLKPNIWKPFIPARSIFWLRHSSRMSAEVILTVLAKIWGIVESKYIFLGFTIRCRRPIAVHWCVTLGSFGKNGSKQWISPEKNGIKTMFFSGHKSESSDFGAVWDAIFEKCHQNWNFSIKMCNLWGWRMGLETNISCSQYLLAIDSL